MDRRECEFCGGIGELWTSASNNAGDCPRCGGTGELPADAPRHSYDDHRAGLRALIGAWWEAREARPTGDGGTT